MGKKIDESQVRHVAKLARLDLSEEEVAEFSGQLSSIFEYIEKLNELDTESAEPLAHCQEVYNIFREDKIKESLDTEKALVNAPQRHDEYFKVPKILDTGSSS